MKTGKQIKRKELMILVNKLKNFNKRTKKYSNNLRLKMKNIGNKNKNLIFYNGNIE